MDQILQVRQVSKWYNDFQALKAVEFYVPEGIIFGLLGPNGAGKTSLIRIITNITQADQGEVLLQGKDTRQVRKGTVGYMPEERGLYKKMKVYEQLIYFCNLRQIKNEDAHRKVMYWLEKLRIADWATKNVEELSKGMQQKIQFIATVMHEPPLLILDEPFSGLDPVNTELIKNEIQELRQQGTSIIFSTHRMEQVEEICDRIVLINQGEKVLDDNVAELKQKWKENLFDIAFQNEPDIASLPMDFQLHQQNNKVIRIQSNDRAAVSHFIAREIAAGNELTLMQEILPTLNQIFIRKVQERA